MKNEPAVFGMFLSKVNISWFYTQAFYWISRNQEYKHNKYIS